MTGKRKRKEGRASLEREETRVRVRPRVGDADVGDLPMSHPIPAADAQPVIHNDQHRQGIPSSSGPPLALPSRSLQDNELSSSRRDSNMLDQITTSPRTNDETTQVEGDLEQGCVIAPTSIPVDASNAPPPPALNCHSRAPSTANIAPGQDIEILELLPDSGHVTGGDRIGIYGRNFPRGPSLYVRFGSEVQVTVRDKSP